MRYTFKNSGVLDLGEPVNIIGHEEYSKRYHDAVPKALVKLGQLEDIEDELGIDLLILLKAMLGSFYVKIKYPSGLTRREKKFGKYCTIYKNETKNDYVIEYDWFGGYYVYVKDYGKTWALTKDELK